MELNQLFKVQGIMENKIKQIVSINEDALGPENTFDLRFLALQVKVGELANLTKCYKYAAAQYTAPKEKLIVRYMDAIKFLLSIGNAYQFNVINEDAITIEDEHLNLIKIFSSIFDDITRLKGAIPNDTYVNALAIYIHLFSAFVHLGKAIGITFEEVYTYYLSHYDLLEETAVC
ncbi:MAG: dUTP diphosphatase [Bacillota bacterium]